MDDDLCGLIPPPDPEALIGPFPLLDRDLFPISRSKIVEALSQAPKLYNNGDGVYGIRVSRITQNVVVKYGAGVKIQEAHNMRLVAEHTSIAVPQVHDFWEEARDLPLSESNSVCYIVMQFIDGNLLSKIWSELDKNLRCSVNEQLFAAVSSFNHLPLTGQGRLEGESQRAGFSLITELVPSIPLPISNHGSMSVSLSARILASRSTLRHSPVNFKIWSCVIWISI